MPFGQSPSQAPLSGSVFSEDSPEQFTPLAVVPQTRSKAFSVEQVRSLETHAIVLERFPLSHSTLFELPDTLYPLGHTSNHASQILSSCFENVPPFSSYGIRHPSGDLGRGTVVSVTVTTWAIVVVVLVVVVVVMHDPDGNHFGNCFTCTAAA